MEQMPKLKGKWAHSRRMTEVGVAKEWNKSLSEFRVLSDEDKAEMIAYEEATADMASVEAHIQAEKVRKAARKK